MAFLLAFLKYLIIFVLLVAVGIGGIFAGKALRKRKNAKLEAAAQEEK